MPLASINRDYFKFGLNVAICSFDQDLFFYHYNASHSIPLEEEGLERESRDWIQFIIARVDIPDARFYVQEGDPAFYNSDTQESFIASGHQLVCLAKDVTFVEPDSIGFLCL